MMEIPTRVLIVSLWIIASILYVTGTLTANATFPMKGNAIRLSCVHNSNSSLAYWFNPRFQPTSLAVCRLDLGMCLPHWIGTAGEPLYIIGVSDKAAFVDILSLNRTRDQAVWRCTDSSEWFDDRLNLTVYTPPVGVNLVSAHLLETPNLGLTNYTFLCHVVGCSYPKTEITWYYSLQSGTNETKMYSGTVASGNITAECTEQEVLYSSTLYLHYGETLPDNSPLTVRFKCGITHPAFDGSMKYSESSEDISFAVNLTYVHLRDIKGNILTGIINVVKDKSESFLCITSGSRPKATVHWFLGNFQLTDGIQDVIRSDNSGVEYVESNLTLTPSDDKHHNMTLHCEAFTTDNSHYLVSTELRFFVQVPVSQIDLQMNGMPITNETISVVSGLSITFICVSGLSRPAATFLWYQGNDLRGTGPNLTLTPKDKDHGKALYCKAYNTDIDSAVYSKRPILKIKGIPEQPNQFTVKRILQNAVIFTWVPGASDGYPQTFVLEGSFAEPDRWEEMTTVSEDYCRSMGIVDNISSGTTYMFRIYAYTSIGNGSYADNVLSVTTLQAQHEYSSSTVSEIGPTIGGTIGGFFLGAVLIALVCIYRKRDDTCLRCLSDSKGKCRQMYKSANTSPTNEETPYQDIKMDVFTTRAEESPIRPPTSGSRQNEETYTALSDGRSDMASSEYDQIQRTQ